MKILPINTAVYAVSKSYSEKRLPLLGARVIPCKVKTYQNDKENIVMICRSTEFKTEITTNSHIIFESLNDAVDSITEIPVKVVKVKKIAIKKVVTKKVTKKK